MIDWKSSKDIEEFRKTASELYDGELITVKIEIEMPGPSWSKGISATGYDFCEFPREAFDKVYDEQERLRLIMNERIKELSDKVAEFAKNNNLSERDVLEVIHTKNGIVCTESKSKRLLWNIFWTDWRNQRI